MVLEKKITAMREELDVKDAQMHEIVKVSQTSDRGNTFIFYSLHLQDNKTSSYIMKCQTM